MKGWEIALFVAATLIAVRSLVHLARQRRDRLIAEVQQQVEAHQEQVKLEKRKRKKEEALSDQQSAVS